MTWKLDKPYSGYNVGQLLGLIQADKEGEYRGQCAEFCGAYHGGMRTRLVVEA